MGCTTPHAFGFTCTTLESEFLLWRARSIPSLTSFFVLVLVCHVTLDCTLVSKCSTFEDIVYVLFIVSTLYLAQMNNSPADDGFFQTKMTGFVFIPASGLGWSLTRWGYICLSSRRFLGEIVSQEISFTIIHPDLTGKRKRGDLWFHVSFF